MYVMTCRPMMDYTHTPLRSPDKPTHVLCFKDILKGKTTWSLKSKKKKISFFDKEILFSKRTL